MRWGYDHNVLATETRGMEARWQVTKVLGLNQRPARISGAVGPVQLELRWAWRSRWNGLPLAEEGELWGTRQSGREWNEGCDTSLSGNAELVGLAFR